MTTALIYNYMSSGHNINIKLYPTKWAEYVEKFGEEIAKEKYYAFCRSFCLEKYQLKYGVEKGVKLFNEKKSSIKRGVTLERYTKKYGLEEGTKKYNEWKSSISGSLETYIKRYGEELGTKKYNDFCKKCSDAVIKAKADENSTYNKRIITVSYDYFLKKANGDEILAYQFLKNRQSNSKLEDFIKRYGDEEGKKRYQNVNMKKAITLENMIRVHGENLGHEKYEKWYFNTGKHSTLQSLIDKHGHDDGTKIYAEINSKKAITLENMIRVHGKELALEKYEQWKKKILSSNKRYSKGGFLFCKELHQLLIQNLNNETPYYGDNEYSVVYKKEDVIKQYFPDFLIKSQKIIVEYYGDYWHRNPEKYSGEQAEKIWELDKQRIYNLNELGYKVFYVYESDITKNYKNTIELLLKEINESWK